MEVNQEKYSLIKDTNAAKLLDEQGYLIQPLLNSQAVKKLLELYESTIPAMTNLYYASIDCKDDAYKNAVDEGIRAVIEAPLKTLLHDFDLMTGNFIVKKPGKASLVYVHTDWTFTEEFDGSPLVIWIPLHDVDKKNGALEVIEGSHHLVPKVRGPGVPNTLLPYHEFIRRKWAKLVPMKAGEVMFFKSNLIHCSPPNVSNSTRVAIRIEVLPAGRKMIIYYQSPSSKDEVGVYEIQKNFFTTYVKGAEPKNASLIKKIKYTPPVFTKSDLRLHLKNERKRYGIF
jgi:ectoine hydroxylase-related dioxygenase (phytanoyl-CoA dioxygenase family)